MIAVDRGLLRRIVSIQPEDRRAFRRGSLDILTPGRRVARLLTNVQDMAFPTDRVVLANYDAPDDLVRLALAASAASYILGKPREVGVSVVTTLARRMIAQRAGLDEIPQVDPRLLTVIGDSSFIPDLAARELIAIFPNPQTRQLVTGADK